MLTQDESLRSAPGNVKRLLAETIAESDCIVHLAGMGYGSDATEPFPDAPAFECSWTQFEYYHGHLEKKDVIAFVCAPALSKAGFTETGKDAADIARKQWLQEEHRHRVEKGTFENTPLPNAPSDRTSNENIGSIPDLLTAVAAAVGTLHKLDQVACGKAQQELSGLAEIVARNEAAIGLANEKLDRILTLQTAPGTQKIPFDLPPEAEYYVGRESAVQWLTDRLRAGKNSAVVGPAGLGKTALAAKAVRAAVGEDIAGLANSPFPDGIVLLDLYALHGSTEEAWHGLADTLCGIGFEKALPASDRAKAACRGRCFLLIVEGAEEADGSAPDRQPLYNLLAVLSLGNRSLILTRELTQVVPAETIKIKESLEDDEAAKLFDHITGTHSLGADVRQRVLTLLEGHPLAITWAANLLVRGDEDPGVLADDWCSQHLPALNDPVKSEHTLRWLFERSVRGLGGEEKIVLEALGLLARAPVPFAVIEALPGTKGRARDCLRHLVQRSLIRIGSEQGHWEFTHVLGYRFARRETASDPEIRKHLDDWLHAVLTSSLAITQGAGALPFLPRYLQHATALLAADGHLPVLWHKLANYLCYAGSDRLLALGQLPLVDSALRAVQVWFSSFPPATADQPSWQRESAAVKHLLGDLAVARGDLPAALRALTDAKNISQSLAASDPANSLWQADLSVALRTLGDLAAAQGDLATAVRSITDSKIISERLALSDPADARWQIHLSVSLDGLGGLAMDQGNLSAALSYYAESRTIRQRLANSDPTNAAWQHTLSLSLNNLGRVALALGDLDGAFHNHTGANAIVERLAASDPANTSWQHQLTVYLDNIGKVAMAQGDLAGALRSFTESMTIRERLTAKDPANATWLRELLISRNNITDVAVAQGDLSDHTAYEEVLNFQRRLASSDLANVRWQRDICLSLDKLGNVAVAQGDLAGALRNFTECKLMRERLVASDPANVTWQRDLFFSLDSLGKIAMAQGDLAGALRFFTDARAISERLASSDSANPQWQRDLSVSHYRLAQHAHRSSDQALMHSELHACFLVLEGMRKRGMHMDSQLANLHAELFPRFTLQ